jgi:hypothetical protein
MAVKISEPPIIIFRLSDSPKIKIDAIDPITLSNDKIKDMLSGFKLSSACICTK